MTRRRPKSRREPPAHREPSAAREASALRAPAAAPPPAASGRRRLLARLGTGAAVLAIVAAGLLVRVIPAWPYVHPAPGETRLFDPDSYYHLRHASHAAGHAFHLQRWDPSVYPGGSAAYYAGLFDLTVAAVGLVAGGGKASPAVVERVAPWVPAVLGALAILAAYFVGRAAHGRAAGLCAALFVLLFAGTFYDRSLFGFVDHHVAEVLLGFLVVLGMTRLLVAQHGPAPPSWRRPAVLHALPMSLFLYSWFGAPIYIVLAVVTFFVVGLFEILRAGDATPVALAVFRWCAGVIVVAAPLALLFPWLVMEPRILLWTLSMAAVVGLGLPLFLRAAAIVARRVSRPVAAAAMVVVAAGGLAALLAVVPSAAVLWAELTGIKTGFVQEQQPVDLRLWWLRSGPTMVLALAAPALALVDAWRRRDPASRLPAVLMGLTVCGLWYKTHDYDYAGGAFTALVAALGLALAIDLVPRRAWRAVAAAAALAAIALVYWPLGKARLRLPDPVRFDNAMHLEEGVVSALRFIRDRTPRLAVPLDDLAPAHQQGFRHPPGNYGVMSFWDLGHYVAAIAERPAVAIGAMSPETARWMLLTDEEQSVRALSEGLLPGEDLRYVVIDARTAADVFGTMVRMVGGSERDYFEAAGEAERADGVRFKIFTFGPKYRGSMAARLFFDPTNLAHYRMIYASPQRHAVAYLANQIGDGTNVVRRSFSLEDPTQAQQWTKMARQGGIIRQGPTYIFGIEIAPTARVYEKVLGARITGSAPPGAKVEARLRLRLKMQGGQDLPYQQAAVAGASGTFELVVPYPTEARPTGSDVAATGTYEVLVNGAPVGRVAVTSDEVRRGATVPLVAR